MSSSSEPGLLDSLTPPFVLLEDRLGSPRMARLYRNPVGVVRCDAGADVDQAFGRIEAALADGLHAAGFLAYELGYALEPKLADLARAGGDTPLLWFGLFERAEYIDGATLDAAFGRLAPPPPIGDVSLALDREAHEEKVRRILDLIHVGDVYQVNLTLPVSFRYSDSPLALYAALRSRQPVAHGAMLVTDEMAILSVSPELFVEVSRGEATVRPMKGTAARGRSARQDLAAAGALAADPKQRAENLMIVDLLRNDLSRISTPGSVVAPRLFTIETYPTFHALTSTVTARLRPDLRLRDRVAALFPCGSITGAPKIRAAEIIRDLEAETRGVYTGAIGAFAPSGDMVFNVAIRTATIAASGDGRYGVGGGIVADSDPAAEYDEAVLKARVLFDLAADYGLIETLRWSAEQGFLRLARHLDRLARSARELGFAFHRAGAEEHFARECVAWPRNAGDRRVRALLSRDGTLAITSESVAAGPPPPLRIGVSEHRLDAADPFLGHKTTRREIQDAAFADALTKGWDEVLFLNRDGVVADASRNTVFAEVDGRLLTPRRRDGALPGVLRADLIEGKRACEATLTLAELQRANGVFLGNSLHGLRPARLVSGRRLRSKGERSRLGAGPGKKVWE